MLADELKRLDLRGMQCGFRQGDRATGKVVSRQWADIALAAVTTDITTTVRKAADEQGARPGYLTCLHHRAGLEGRPALALGPLDGADHGPPSIECAGERRFPTVQEVSGDRHHYVVGASPSVLSFEAEGPALEAHVSLIVSLTCRRRAGRFRAWPVSSPAQLLCQREKP